MGKKKSSSRKIHAFYLLLSQTQLVHKFIILQPKPASGFTSPFLLKILFKLSKPGVITDSFLLLPAPRSTCAHTYTHTSYIHSGSPIGASCTFSLILSVSCNSGPQHLSDPPLHKVRAKVLWVQLSNFHRTGLGTVPSGIGCMESKDNSQK